MNFPVVTRKKSLKERKKEEKKCYREKSDTKVDSGIVDEEECARETCCDEEKWSNFLAERRVLHFNISLSFFCVFRDRHSENSKWLFFLYFQHIINRYTYAEAHMDV